MVAKEQIKDPEVSSASSGGGPSLTTKPPDHFTFITWNIDGLDERNLKLRCRAVIDKIEEVQADIVFLQEVIPQTFEYMKKKLEKQFQFIQVSIGIFPWELGYSTCRICMVKRSTHEHCLIHTVEFRQKIMYHVTTITSTAV